jgi:hypothetical protein
MAEMGVKTGCCYPGLPKTQGQQVGFRPIQGSWQLADISKRQAGAGCPSVSPVPVT